MAAWAALAGDLSLANPGPPARKMKGPPRRRPPAGTNWFGMKSSPGDSHHRAFDAPWGLRNTTVFSYPNPSSAVVAFRSILTQANAASFRPPGPQLRKHTEVTRRGRTGIFPAHGPTYPVQMSTAGHERAALASGDRPGGRAQFVCFRPLSGLHPASFHPQGNRQASGRGLIGCCRPDRPSVPFGTMGLEKGAERRIVPSLAPP
jgi:hypothetical protein